jgi:hypothetical protein
MELFLQLADLVLQMQEQSVVQSLELAIDGLDLGLLVSLCTSRVRRETGGQEFISRDWELFWLRRGAIVHVLLV